MINKKRGFTLIELLVAIAIIGILASLLIVGLTKAKQKANQARAWQSFKQIALAMQLYYDKEGHWPNPKEGADGYYCFSRISGCDSTGEPAFVADGTYPNWDASWYCSDCIYSFYIYDIAKYVDGQWIRDGKPDCGYIMIINPTYNPYIYIYRYELCLTSLCGSKCGKGYWWPK